LGYLLGKNYRRRDRVLSFRSEAREASGSETARFHHAARRRGGVADHGARRNIETVFRWAEGKYERFPVLIAELVAAKVDMIVTAGTPASLAVKNANTSIPLIMIAVSEPVATGLVASFARPGGNITGLTSMAPEIDGKRLELLRELVPNISYIAVLWNAGARSRSSKRRRREPRPT